MTVTGTDQRCTTCGATRNADDRYCRTCGYPQAGDVVPPMTPSAALLPVRPPTSGLVIAAVLVGALLVLITPLLVVRSLLFGPDNVTDRYFSALADRDADDALRYLSGGEAARAGNPLLTDETLDSDGYSPPRNVSIDGVDIDGKNATVRVSYEVAGARLTAGMALTRGGDGTGVLDRWRISEGGLAPLPLQVARPDLLIAGRQLPFEEPGLGGTTGQPMAFLGGYALALTDNPLIEIPPTTLIAGGEAGRSQSVRMKATADRAIREQVSQWLDGCVASKEADPPGCPFSYSSFGRVLSITWRLTQEPEVQLRLSEAEPGTVEVSGSGFVRASGRTDSEFSPAFDETNSFTFSGTAAASGGEVRFSAGD